MAVFLFQEGYGVMVLNPNENYQEVEIPASALSLPTSVHLPLGHTTSSGCPVTAKHSSPAVASNGDEEKEKERVWLGLGEVKRCYCLEVSNPTWNKEDGRNMNQREMDVKSRVRAVAFTDSAHNIWHQDTSKGIQDWMQQDERRRVKERRRDLEINACCARLYRPHGSEEGQLTSLPGDQTQCQ
ncbi:unnamed protein product [Tetraodon nigroviridis]|uniref:(spotted green pufferfish) hypothetical protein n=1 Tax=Tetraodon nigroviridis TaxID=99883 RepID=Q4RUL6_TETNG|nr:unnamed protein product [Tetraodon nigroviridis]